MSNRYGLIGKNIAYSKSPGIHLYMAKKLGIDLTYDLIDCEEDELSKWVKLLRNGSFQGFNITIPYKQKIMRHLDEITPKAQRIHAVNTVFLKNGKVIGDNTDYDGFLGLLIKHDIDVKNKNVYILGTGGAAKAAYVVLKDIGACVTVVSRALSDTPSFFHHVITYAMINPNDVDIYVNTTPVGTHPKINDTVIDQSKISDQIVIDLIYNPEHTKLMTFSNKAYNGLYMLIIQALKSEEIWFNRKIDVSKKLLQEIKEVVYQ